MPHNHIHIISFDIPYPANYGGVIDVFHKIRLLHENGIHITLHCFQYRDKKESEELEKLCDHVFYYKRKTGIKSNFSTLPYIVYSRQNESLINNLLKDNSPIIFEGKHSCYYIDDDRLKNRLKIYRACNIEHDYYKGLHKAEKNIAKKIFFYIEAVKLKLFRRHLISADIMLGISESDTAELQKLFPHNKVLYVPAFHPNDVFDIQEQNNGYILYHGKLSVPENEQAALYLIKNVFKNQTHLPFIIAGLDPSDHLKKECKENNITLIDSPSEEKLKQLVQQAAINLLYTAQPTGIKLKLLNVLHNGKYCVVNDKMLEGTDLNSVCHIANSPKEIKNICEKLLTTPFDEKEKQNRIEKMKNQFSNQKSADIILGLLQ